MSMAREASATFKRANRTIRRRRCFSLIAAAALTPVGTSAQGPAAIAAEPQLTLSEVVENLVQKNAERAKALQSYRGKRIYKLDFKGFHTALRAEMIVEITYTAPAKKISRFCPKAGAH